MQIIRQNPGAIVFKPSANDNEIIALRKLINILKEDVKNLQKEVKELRDQK